MSVIISAVKSSIEGLKDNTGFSCVFFFFFFFCFVFFFCCFFVFFVFFFQRADFTKNHNRPLLQVLLFDVARH